MADGARPVKVFYSYSRRDEEFRKRLDESLAIHKDGLIEVWWDQAILAGDEWQGAINENLRDADIVLLLLSPSFLASPHCKAEMLTALDRLTRRDSVRVIGIHVRACGFQDAGLGHLQMVPRNGRAVNSRKDADEAWEEVRVEIAEAARAIRPKAGEIRMNPKDGLPYVWIPAGRFQMGCSPGDRECLDDEKPAHDVRIERGFWIGQTPVTQAAYRNVMGEDRSLPVDGVKWDEAVRYAESVGGRLPTEAEWEYAARAGSTEARYGPIERTARFDGNSKGHTWPVGGLEPNAWGLHDALGNVWEWTADRYEPYSDGATIPAQWLLEGEYRVVRGSSFLYLAENTRASQRLFRPVDVRFRDQGFRCVWC